MLFGLLAFWASWAQHFNFHVFLLFIFDGFVKSPTSALCFIPQTFNVQEVRLMIAKFARPEFELFTKPSKFDSL
jgi:hypothetical protein